MGTAVQTIVDYSGEASPLTYKVDDADVSGVDTQSLLTATSALTIGHISKVALTTITTNPGNATNVYAQRELKWLVRFQDTVNAKISNLEIPCPDLTGNLNGNSDDALLTSTDWAAWVTAFEAVAVSIDGNPVTVIGAKLVGRNI